MGVLWVGGSSSSSGRELNVRNAFQSCIEHCTMCAKVVGPSSYARFPAAARCGFGEPHSALPVTFVDIINRFVTLTFVYACQRRLLYSY